MIDTKEELSKKLEDAYRELFDKHQNRVNVKRYLDRFELDMRMGVFSEMVKQSNSQKMQLVLEDYIRRESSNWSKWQTLRDSYTKAELESRSAEITVEYLKDVLRIFEIT